MASTILTNLLALLPLSILTSPFPTPPTDPIIQSPPFKLSSRPLDPSLTNLTNLTNLYLSSYHIAPAYDYAVLVPETAQDSGRVGYLNGTAADFENENADLLFPSGSGTDFPYGFIIDQTYNESYIPVEINGGAGTSGIFIDQGVIKVHDPLSGGFYACNKTLPYGPAIQLFYKVKYIATPVGCGDVELVVEYE